MYFSTTIKVEHQTAESGNSNLSDYVFDAGLTAVQANIQPLNPYQTDQYGGAYSSTYKMFLPVTASGVVETDRITDNKTGVTYIVKGKNTYNYGLGQHLECMIDEVIR